LGLGDETPDSCGRYSIERLADCWLRVPIVNDRPNTFRNDVNPVMSERSLALECLGELNHQSGRRSARRIFVQQSFLLGTVPIGVSPDTAAAMRRRVQ
jgi:hypothetical protein